MMPQLRTAAGRKFADRVIVFLKILDFSNMSQVRRKIKNIKKNVENYTPGPKGQPASETSPPARAHQALERC